MPMPLAEPGTSPGHILSMVAVSLAFHAGLAAGIWPALARQPVGTDETVKTITVELVAAPAPPRPAKEEPPAPEPQKKAEVKIPVKTLPKPARKASAAKVERPATEPKTPAEEPALSAPSDGVALMSSASAETRAAGRRAYGQLVWKKIVERKPPGLRLPGTALVEFALDRRGAIVNARIVETSGDAELDALALKTVAGAAPFDPPPAELTAEDLVFEIPFTFR
jgi:protein TonB